MCCVAIHRGEWDWIEGGNRGQVSDRRTSGLHKRTKNPTSGCKIPHRCPLPLLKLFKLTVHTVGMLDYRATPLLFKPSRYDVSLFPSTTSHAAAVQITVLLSHKVKHSKEKGDQRSSVIIWQHLFMFLKPKFCQFSASVFCHSFKTQRTLFSIFINE